MQKRNKFDAYITVGTGLLILSLLMVSCLFHSKSIGLFEGKADIGHIKRPGHVLYNSEKQEYTLDGSGTNMWFDHDGFFMVWKRMKSDFILQARAQFVSEGVEQHRKIGWIVRSSLDSTSAYADAVVHGNGLTSLQFRRKLGNSTEEIKLPITGADVLQLERKGNNYSMSAATFGESLVSRKISNLALGDEVYVGLFVCAHNNDIVEKAIFRDVRIIVPARDNFVPYQDYLGSNLEILDVESGNRKIIYSSPEPLQAPNWTPDGQALIFNKSGRLFRFNLAKGIITAINTDFATSNNNDHVLSFDGKMLGISHHSSDDQNRSIIYVLPDAGGKPRRVTSAGPSYLHGWSPDGQFLVYTGERNGEFDIYKIPIDGGQEIRLTDAAGLDDGAEYTPDGNYIYFNSVRIGTMQIWRMKPDGSDQEQVVNDEFNNWFPHISPDGKRIIFLSFSKDVKPNDHPHYKQVYIRMMPIEGGGPRVVAYVYGGQGTINVPSWSPDNRHVAFISNTDMN